MEYITKKDLIDCSTPDEFCFSLCCMECKTVWKSTPIRFSKAGKKPENENRKIIYDTLYDREKNLAFQKALNQAKEIFNICLVFIILHGSGWIQERVYSPSQSIQQLNNHYLFSPFITYHSLL